MNKSVFIFLFATLAGGTIARIVLRADTPPAPPLVRTVRVPNGGIQPQVVTDGKGVVHLVYFSGDASAGDLFYVRSKDAGVSFTEPLRVNTHPGSAIAVGNIRGAHLALGANDRVHVSWNGSQSAVPKGPQGKPPMLYTRLNDAGTGFEPERSVIQSAYGIDGGGAVAADSGGRVYVFWHAPLPGGKGEAARRVWVAKSGDDGKTFARETVAWDQPTGACACCGLNAFAAPDGSVYVLFRSAAEMVNRDIYLLASRDHAASFQGTDISKWKVGYCVMSSEAFAPIPNGVLSAWETEKQIYYGRIDPATGKLSQPVSAPGGAGNRKYPALAANAEGQTLLAWTEGMGWKKGGSVAWQIFDPNGRPIGSTGAAEGVPAWSLVAVFRGPGNTFTVLY